MIQQVIQAPSEPTVTAQNPSTARLEAMIDELVKLLRKEQDERRFWHRGIQSLYMLLATSLVVAVVLGVFKGLLADTQPNSEFLNYAMTILCGGGGATAAGYSLFRIIRLIESSNNEHAAVQVTLFQVIFQARTSRSFRELREVLKDRETVLMLLCPSKGKEPRKWVETLAKTGSSGATNGKLGH